jgi:hypothetical protein
VLLPIPAVSDDLDERAHVAAQTATRHTVERTLRSYPVDVVHVHGLDFDRDDAEEWIEEHWQRHLPTLRQRVGISVAEQRSTGR